MNIIRYPLVRAAIAAGVPQQELVEAHDQLEKAMFPATVEPADILAFWSARKAMTLGSGNPQAKVRKR